MKTQNPVMIALVKGFVIALAVSTIIIPLAAVAPEVRSALFQAWQRNLGFQLTISVIIGLFLMITELREITRQQRARELMTQKYRDGHE